LVKVDTVTAKSVSGATKTRDCDPVAKGGTYTKDRGADLTMEFSFTGDAKGVMVKVSAQATYSKNLTTTWKPAKTSRYLCGNKAAKGWASSDWGWAQT
jgi:hypothetical protein